MRHSEALSKLTKLMAKPLFLAAEARKLGVSSRLLSYYVSRGDLERLDRGVYRAQGAETGIAAEWENLALTAASVPQGVICLVSALAYYNLTDEIMRRYWIAVPHKTRHIKRSKTRIVRMRNMKLGRKPLKLGKLDIYIFDRERTIVDAFRYLGKEVAIKALKAAVSSKNPGKIDLIKLQQYSKALRVPISPYLMTVTT